MGLSAASVQLRDTPVAAALQLATEGCTASTHSLRAARRFPKRARSRLGPGKVRT
jgi:hypothetical protein